MKTQDQLLQMPVCRGSKHSKRQPLSLTKARLDMEHVPNGRRVFVGCYSGGLILSLTLATFGCISVLQKQQKKRNSYAYRAWRAHGVVLSFDICCHLHQKTIFNI